MRINKNIWTLKWIFYMSILLSLFLFTYRVFAVEYEEPVHKDHIESQPITHEEIVVLTDKFMEQLVQEVDDHYKVIHFDTKEALMASFDNISRTEVTAEYVEFYYEERSDGLYILPTETPPWFIEKNDYDMIQLNENQVEVIQENETDLYGQYAITFEFTFDHGHWKISNINIT